MDREKTPQPGLVALFIGLVLVACAAAIALGRAAARRAEAARRAAQLAAAPEQAAEEASPPAALPARWPSEIRGRFDFFPWLAFEDLGPEGGGDGAFSDEPPPEKGEAGAPPEPALVENLTLASDALAAAAERIVPAAASDGAPLAAISAARPVMAREEPRSSVSGRVLDRRGVPIAGAAVRLLAGSRTWNFATSGEDGRYVLEGVKAGRYSIHALAEGWIEAAGPAPLDIVAGEARSGLDLQLDEAGAIDGSVVNEAWEPVAGAEVFLERPGVFGPARAVTDEEGRFRLLGARGGQNTIRVRHDRFVEPPPRAVDVPRLEDGTPGVLCGVQLVLSAGARIEGELFGPDGALVAGGVELQDEGGRRVKGAQAPAGFFALFGIPPGRFQLVAWGGPSLGARESLTILGADRRRIDLALSATGQIAGHTVDAQGFPLEGVRLSVSAQGFGLGRGASSGADGSFQMGGLLDGRYLLVVEPPERFAAPPPATLTVAGGACPEDLVIELRPAAALAGRVVALDGGPAAGAQVAVYDLSGSLVGRAEADPAGRFRIPRLPPGTIDVYAQGPHGGLARFATRVTPAEEHVATIALAPPARIRGSLLLRDGRPLAGATIEARSEEGIVHRTTQTGPDGGFYLGDLYGGRYVIRATEGRLVAIAELDVPASAFVDRLTLIAR
jgi:hypothetical protein